MKERRVLRKIAWFLMGLFVCVGLTRALTVAPSQKNEGGGAHGTGIENHRWRIAKYFAEGKAGVGRGGLVAATVGAEITFRGGRVEGSPGCGGWAGTYAISGDVLTVRADSAVAGLCSSEMLAQSGMVERDFKRELRIVPIADDVLLTDKEGKAQILLLPFERK